MHNQFILTPYFLDEPMPGLESLAADGWWENKPSLGAGDSQTRMAPIHEGLAGQVARALAEGKLPVSVAGDCCTAIGVAAGLQRAGLDPLLVWFDAHGDFNTWETTPSGFLGGMPLAMIAGLGEQTMPRAVGLRPLEQAKIVLSDGRDLDPGERELVAESGIQHVRDVRMLAEALDNDLPLHIHFDTDVIDPLEAPAMNYPAPGGPRAAQLEGVFRYLAQQKRIAAVSVSSWNPVLDRNGRTREVCMGLLDVLLGA